MHKTIILSLTVLGLSILLGGCAPPHARYAAELTASIKTINNIIFAYKKVQQPEHVKNIQTEVRELVDKLKEDKSRLDEAAPEDAKVKDKVLKKYSESLDAILSNLDAENKRVAQMGLNQEVYKMTNNLITSYKTLVKTEAKGQPKN